ncbi:MAG: hypothetical protein N4A74_12475 [Carboxylicivirga sp.]|nr:hypothetical protein [Carboxylicivirga sp.]
MQSLNPLIEKLKSKIEIIQLKIDNVEAVINKIKDLPENSDILFVGHGASHCLYGAINEGDKEVFINSANVDIFKNKNIIVLACRSSEFLNDNRGVLKSYLGFGNIPSDWEEVLAERDLGDANYLSTIDEDDLKFYVDKITDISTICLLAYLSHNSISKLFLDYRLHFNRSISSLNIKKERKNYKGLSELFINTKNDIDHCVN